MPKTVMGLFTTPVEAEKVKQLLIEEGYAPASIRVLSNESDGFAEGAVAEARSTAPGDSGVLGSIKNFFHSLTGSDDTEEDYYTRAVSSGGALLAVAVEDGNEESVISLLEAQGARDVNQEGAPGRQTATAGAAAATTSGGTIPVIEEELQIGKRQVQRGGVRVYSHLVETPVEEDVQLREEHIRVAHTPVDRPASTADFDNFKDRTIELTEMAEEVVVAKQARVVEEVSVGKDVTERTQKVEDTVRHTDIEVEEIPGEASLKDKSAGAL